VLSISLFGKLSLREGATELAGLEGHKAQELLCYLLLYRDQPHAREKLSTLLWGGKSDNQSRKNLRQALWQLQASISSQATGRTNQPLLLVDSNWIQFNAEANAWIDIAEFEQAFTGLQSVPGRALGKQRAQSLEKVVDLYHGDLLEGCYEDWCLYERERLQNMYLAMLEKLIAYCEVHNRYPAGLAYGERILRLDGARERTHRRLMRLQYLAGDRTKALRQYERCVGALADELGVGPAARTVKLYEQIRSEQLLEGSNIPTGEVTPSSLSEVLRRLNELKTVIDSAQQELKQDIKLVERAMNDRT
jgi:DNA-binding SARP family transcriptional activator